MRFCVDPCMVAKEYYKSTKGGQHETTASASMPFARLFWGQGLHLKMSQWANPYGHTHSTQYARLELITRIIARAWAMKRDIAVSRLPRTRTDRFLYFMP